MRTSAVLVTGFAEPVTCGRPRFYGRKLRLVGPGICGTSLSESLASV